MSEADARVGVVRDATERLLEQNDRANRTKNRLIAVVAVVLIVLLAGFGAVTVVEQAAVNRRLLAQEQTVESILADVSQTINPQSALAQHNSRSVQNLVIHVELCIYRHEDQIAAETHHQPIPPPLPGCPAEKKG